MPRLGIDLPVLGLRKDDPVLIRGINAPVAGADPAGGALSAVLPEIRRAGPLTGLPRAAGNDNDLAKEIRQRRDQRNLTQDRMALFGESDSGKIF